MHYANNKYGAVAPHDSTYVPKFANFRKELIKFSKPDEMVGRVYGLAPRLFEKIIPMHWQRLDRDTTIKVIDSVKSASDPGLITPGASEVQSARTPFYDGILLYKITNFASLPSFTFEYLGDGTFFHYLDGTETPLYTVADKGALRLTPATVVPYLEFFFAHVTGEDGEEMLFIRDPHDMPLLDSLDPEAYDAVMRGHKPADIKIMDDGGFHVSADLYDGGRLSRAEIDVTPAGRVTIAGRRMILQNVARGAESGQYVL